MSRVLRRKSGDLDVVPHDVILQRQPADVSFEELLLEIPARSPRQHATDVQVLAQDMSHHGLGGDALRRGFVMGATGGMHVMVARIPTQIGQLDPAFQLEGFAMCLRLRHGHLSLLESGIPDRGCK